MAENERGHRRQLTLLLVACVSIAGLGVKPDRDVLERP